ncbi:acetyltransferase [Winogradskyella thalassocola]|uniref:Sugar O-acyltransferase, sialic acid O-acetyltransferase NeuD family n=1 Tax=Winogradskyella thalassocola TaxID=262004 RepID=A0A1G8KLH9_9FLAO|nr:acetyltransferase [Winogradskyella thalassocola]SDI44287.1 sugar O-acyltransferase, sialic acid O-acetyltransferase NeuD family [Winogradskyella thalassocola]
MKNILIYGASGHAKMIIDIIHRNNKHKIIGFLDSYKPRNKDIFGYKIIGNLDTLPTLIEQHNIQGIVIAVGDNSNRQKAYNNISKITSNLEFVPIVHPSAIIARDVVISEGAVVMPSVVINANAKIGRFTILNTMSSLGHDSVMSDFSSLASGATIGGNVNIGLCSAICLKTTIIQNISVGDHTIIGAASLVVKSIGDLKKAFGSPIHTIKDRKPNSKYLG